MEISNELQDKLRAYAQGKLSKKEMDDTGQLLIEHPELKTEVDFIKQLTEGAEAVERDRLLKMAEGALEGMENIPSEKVSEATKSKSILLVIIGLLALATIAFWYFYKKESSVSTPPTPTQITLPVAKALIQKNYLKSGALEQSLLKPFNTLSTTEDDIRNVKTLLTNYQYTEVINLIQTLPKEHPHFGRMQLIYGYCLLQQEKPIKAFERFDFVQQSSSNVYLQEEAEWLKVLTLILQQQEKTTIQAALKRILENESHSYHMEAEELHKRF